MSQEKADIFLGRIMQRIDRGEFDNELNIPFASRKLMKSLVEARMAKKVETNSTPVLSDLDLAGIIEEVRATAAETAAIFGWAGILQKNEEDPKFQVTEEWDNILNPKKDEKS